MLVPNVTKSLAIAQALQSHKPVAIYHYNKTFVILPQGYTLADDVINKAVKVAEIDALGNYNDCMDGQQED